MNRRRFLIGTASATTLLAGCAGSDDSPATDEPSTTRPPTSSVHPTPNDSPTTEPPTTEPPTTEPPTTEPPTTEPPTTEPPTTDPSDGGSFVNGSFESELEGWTIGKDLPPDPNGSGEPVDSKVETSTQQASSGSSSLSIFIDGSADDGTVWVQQEADLSAVSTLTVEGYSPQKSFNTILEIATYTGPTKDLSETDFDRSEKLQDHEGWKTYEYDVDHDGTGLVAVGFNIVWETGAGGFLDNVRLE